ncbi:MAG: ATP-binding protein [Faecalibacterium sp.]
MLNELLFSVSSSLIYDELRDQLASRITTLQLQQCLQDAFPSLTQLNLIDNELSYDGLKSYVMGDFLNDARESVFLPCLAYKKALCCMQKKACASAHAQDAGIEITNHLIIRLTNLIAEKYENLIPSQTRLLLNQNQAIASTQNAYLEDSHALLQDNQSLLLEITDALSYADNEFTRIIDNISNYHGITANRFHYLNTEMGFYGRDKEESFLYNFLDDPCPIRVLSIYGPGGSGKSKLLYEFTKKNKANWDWKIVLLNEQKLTSIIQCSDYAYRNNLMVVIDYSNKHAVEIGKWLNTLLNTTLSKKIRIVLINRLGPYTDPNYGDIIYPYWYTQLQANCRVPLGSNNFDWLEIKDLQRNDLFNIMDNFAKISKTMLTEQAKENIFNYVSTTLFKNTNKPLPLYFLIVTDAHINGKEFSHWDTEDVLDYTLTRNKLFWFDHFAENDPAYTAFLKLLYLCTATGSFDIYDTHAPYFSNDLTVLCSYSSQSDRFIPQLENHCLLQPVEPDIIGEYFVLHYLSTLPLIPLRQTITAYWFNPQGFIQFLSRAFETYAQLPRFKKFLEKYISCFAPTSDILKQNQTAVFSLFNNMILYLNQETFESAYIAFKTNNYDSPSCFTTFAKSLATNATESAHYEISIFIYKNILKSTALTENDIIDYKLCIASCYGFQEKYTDAIKTLTEIKRTHSLFLGSDLSINNLSSDILEIRTIIECELCYARSLSSPKSDIANAEKEFFPLLQAYSNLANPNPKHLSNFWYNYAVYLCKKQNPDFNIIEDVLAHADQYCSNPRKKAQIYNQTAIYYDKVADQYQKNKQYTEENSSRNKAFHFYRLSLEIRTQDTTNLITTSIARAQDNLGRFMALHNRMDERTEILLTTALQTHTHYFKGNNSIVARNLFNLGIYYLERAKLTTTQTKHFLSLATKRLTQAKTMFENIPHPEEQKNQYKWCIIRLNEAIEMQKKFF